jgi:hypothetical protein
VSIRNCCNRPIIKNCYLEKGIAFKPDNLFSVLELLKLNITYCNNVAEDVHRYS